jgi:biotin-(acetyl-CoA carboxylase) ligase
MGRLGVTFEDIKKAANQLKVEGKHITIENVRAILGTGSISTINKYLQQWKQAQLSNITKDKLGADFNSLMKEAWDKISEQFSQKISLLIDNYQIEISNLKKEVEKYQKNNQRWQKLFTDWQPEKIRLEQENKSLLERIKTEKLEVEA